MSEQISANVPGYPLRFNFGIALMALKEGRQVKRESWGGYWSLIQNAGVSGDAPKLNGYSRTAHMDNIIIAVLKDNAGCAPAQPYQQDILAEDWQIVN